MDSELVALLRELVGIPSMNPYRGAEVPPGYGEAAIAERVAAFLRDSGLPVTLQEIAPGRPNILARLESSHSALGTRHSTLLFVAHLDTVPVDGMTIPPFEGFERDGRLWGRGSCDNKGSLAAMLTALRRVAAAKSNSSTILFAGTADEESGYRGIRAALGKCGVRSAECGVKSGIRNPKSEIRIHPR
jgi:acetylornithine deacetylase